MMLEPTKHNEKNQSICYKIKLIISIEKDKQIEYQNEFIIPTLYKKLKDAQFHILMDIEYRLTNTMYFRSYKKGYDLVKYSKEATVNTYLSYRIFPLEEDSFLP